MPLCGLGVGVGRTRGKHRVRVTWCHGEFIDPFATPHASILYRIVFKKGRRVDVGPGCAAVAATPDGRLDAGPDPGIDHLRVDGVDAEPLHILVLHDFPGGAPIDRPQAPAPDSRKQPVAICGIHLQAGRTAQRLDTPALVLPGGATVGALEDAALPGTDVQGRGGGSQVDVQRNGPAEVAAMAPGTGIAVTVAGVADVRVEGIDGARRLGGHQAADTGVDPRPGQSRVAAAMDIGCPRGKGAGPGAGKEHLRIGAMGGQGHDVGRGDAKGVRPGDPAILAAVEDRAPAVALAHRRHQDGGRDRVDQHGVDRGVLPRDRHAEQGVPGAAAVGGADHQAEVRSCLLGLPAAGDGHLRVAGIEGDVDPHAAVGEGQHRRPARPTVVADQHARPLAAGIKGAGIDLASGCSQRVDLAGQLVDRGPARGAILRPVEG